MQELHLEVSQLFSFQMLKSIYLPTSVHVQRRQTMITAKQHNLGSTNKVFGLLQTTQRDDTEQFLFNFGLLYEYRVALCYGFLENTSVPIYTWVICIPDVLASQPSKSIFIHRPLSQYCGLILTCRAITGWGSFVIFLSSTYFPMSSLKRDWNVGKINVK